MERIKKQTTPKLAKLANLTIGEMAVKLFTGLSTSGRSVAARNEGDVVVRVISIGDLDGELGIVRNEVRKTIMVESLSRVKQYLVEPGDVLLSCRGTTNKVAVYGGHPQPTAISSNLIAIRLDPQFEPAFLLAFLQSAQGQQAVLERERGNFQKLLRTQDILSMPIPLPPIEDQRKIVKIMDAANEAYRLAIDAAELRKNITREIFNRYITGEMRLEDLNG